jgi:hypothetical protein
MTRSVCWLVLLLSWNSPTLVGAQGPGAAPAEAEAVRKIEALGGRVYRNAAGHVEMVDLKGQTIGDEHLAMLQELPALRNLNLDGSGVTDRGLRHLLQVPALEEVSLLRTRVTPAAAQSLKDRHPKIFYVALSPRSAPLALAFVPLIAFPLGAVGIWLMRAAHRKREILAPRTYVQGIAYGLLLVLAAVVIAIMAVVRALGFDFHLSDLAG